MNITVRLNDKRIRTLIGGSLIGYWAKDLEFIGRTLAFTVVEHGDERTPKKLHTVSETMVRRGLVAMANAPSDEGGHHFAAVCDWKQSDMWTGDAIVQFAIFGEMKYG